MVVWQLAQSPWHPSAEIWLRGPSTGQRIGLVLLVFPPMPEAQHARDPYAVYDNYNPDEVSWLR